MVRSFFWQTKLNEIGFLAIRKANRSNHQQLTSLASGQTCKAQDNLIHTDNIIRNLALETIPFKWNENKPDEKLGTLEKHEKQSYHIMYGSLSSLPGDAQPYLGWNLVIFLPGDVFYLGWKVQPNLGFDSSHVSAYIPCVQSYPIE